MCFEPTRRPRFAALVCLIGAGAFTFGFLLMLCARAFADDGAAVADPSPAWQVTLLNAAVTLLSAVLTALVPYAIILVQRWTGAKIQREQAEMWARIAADAVRYGEEYARRKLRDVKIQAPGHEKLSVAVDYAYKQATALGLPAMAAERVKALLEANLPEMRASLHDYPAPKPDDLDGPR